MSTLRPEVDHAVLHTYEFSPIRSLNAKRFCAVSCSLPAGNKALKEGNFKIKSPTGKPQHPPVTRTFLFYSSAFGRAGPDNTLLLAVVQQGASEHICPLAHRANKPSQDPSMLLTGCLTCVCAFSP